MGISSSIYKTKINQFDFIKKDIIGIGGFSLVTSVILRHNNCEYAMKTTLLVRTMSTSGHTDYIKNEIKALKLIGNYPYIVNLKYAFHNYRECSLVLDLINGGDLRYKLDKVKNLNESECALVAYCIGSALQYIHEKNILHRDIKPENILLDQYGSPYLTDFGLCYINENLLVGETLVCSLRSGTPQYVSPEFFSKSHFHGIASDYWALGITLFELSYGSRPYLKMPTDYMLYAEQRMYYEIETNNIHPQFDQFDNVDDILLFQDDYVDCIVRSDLFQNFLCQLLDIRIFYRLGRKHSFRPLLEHPWILHYQNSTLETVTRKSLSTSETIPLHTMHSNQTIQTIPHNSVCLDEDIRNTKFFNKDIESILNEYEYEYTANK